MNEPKPQLSLSDYLGIVWRRRRTALLLAGLFACATFIVFNFTPRRYTAEAVFERRGDAVSARTDRNIPEKFPNLKPLLRFELTGIPAIRTALDDLGYVERLQQDASGRPVPDGQARLSDATNRIQKDLEITWVVSSEHVDRVALQFTNTDPVLTQRLPNQLVSNYIRNTRRELLEQLGSSCGFLTERVRTSRETLANLREQRYNFALAYPDMLPDNPRFYTERVAQLDQELDDLRQRRQAVEARLNTLRDLEAAPALPPPSSPNPEYASAVARIEQLKRELDNAYRLDRMTEKHPKVAVLLETLQQAREELKGIPAEVEGPAADPALSPSDRGPRLLEIAQAQSDLEQAARELTRKEEVRQRYEKVQASLMPVTQEYQRLTALIEDAENDATVWQRNLAEVQMALDAERNGTRTHLGVVRLAEPVFQPSWPPLWFVFGLALGGGLVFAAVAVILRERLARSFVSTAQICEALALPVLAVVGPILGPAARRARAIRRYALAPALTALVLAIMALAAAGVVISTKYPGEYARFMEQLHPAARAVWTGTRSLLGVS